MKSAIISLMILSVAGAALAIEPAELDNRILTLTEKFESFQHQPDKRIPPATLRKARGIILLDRTKAGFLFAYQGGGGVAMVRDANSDQWSAVAFLDANEASLGFQIGGEQHFYIVLLMSTNSTWMLLDQKFELGGEARGTAGNNSSGVEAAPPANQRCWFMTTGRGCTPARPSKPAPSPWRTRPIAFITGNTLRWATSCSAIKFNPV